MKEHWNQKIADPTVVRELMAVLGISRSLAEILCGRGILSTDQAYRFLHPELSMIPSPFLMKGMHAAVGRIRSALARGELIGVFSDSDLDGLTSLAVLVTLFRGLDIDPAPRYIYRYPRDSEQYGLTNSVIDEFTEAGVSLLITLDCGIRDVNEIGYAAEKGIEVIVCDHHEPDHAVPDSIIVNPKQEGCSYPFRDLAGVGVACKLCQAVLYSFIPSYNRRFTVITGDGPGISLLFIRNGIVEDRVSNADIGTVEEKVSAGDAVILYDNGHALKTQLRSLSRDRIYDCTGEINTIISENPECFKAVYPDPLDRLVSAFQALQYKNSKKLQRFFDKALGLVSLGSIADIVPVTGETRTLVHHGIRALHGTDHPGLSLLVDKKEVTSKTVGWYIAPMLNSPARFGNTALTADFLVEADAIDVHKKFAEIRAINERRKNRVTELYSDIVRQLGEGTIRSDNNLLFIMSDEVEEGLAGLLANRLADHVNKPVVVISLKDPDLAKGSARVHGAFNFFSCLEPHAHLFEKFGGHAQAFGFTAARNKLEEIHKVMKESVGYAFSVTSELQIDSELAIDEITVKFVKELSVLHPFGQMNEEPVFLSRNIRVDEFLRFGSDKQHGKYCIGNGSRIEAIMWNGADEMEQRAAKGQVDIVYRLENNEFNGKVRPRLILLDID